jgi:hypothetical protein
MNPVNPTSRVRLRRKINGFTARRIPLVGWGDIDWGDIGWGDIDWGPLHGGSFDRHLLRTDAAGLASVVNLEPFAGLMSIP